MVRRLECIRGENMMRKCDLFGLEKGVGVERIYLLSPAI